MLAIKEIDGGISLKIKVQPRASKNEVAGVLNDALKIRLTSPPVDGEANATCIEFLAKFFKVSKSQVEITSGLTGRNKTIVIQSIDLVQAREVLRKWL